MADIPVNASDAVTIVSVTVNGQVNFAFDFRADLVGDLRAEYRPANGDPVTVLVGGLDFTATGLTVSTGGTITLTSFVTVAGDSMAIYRDITVERETDYTRDLFSDDINAELDRVFMILQEITRDLARGMQLPLGYTGDNDLVPEDGTILGWIGSSLVNRTIDEFISEGALPKTGGTMTGPINNDGPNGDYQYVGRMRKGGIDRWAVGQTNNSEADFFIDMFTDLGAFDRRAFSIDRQTGIVYMNGGGPEFPQIGIWKTPSNTYSDAFTSGKSYMAALGVAADAPMTGMFVVPAGVDVGNTAWDFQDTRLWFMPGSKGNGNNAPRIEHHVRNLQNGFRNHQDHTHTIMRWYDAEMPSIDFPGDTDGYLKGGAPLSLYSATGQFNPAIGTTFSLFLVHEVFDTATPDHGRNEPAGIYNYIAARNGRTQNVTNFWLQDNHMITPKTAPGWAGASIKIGNMAAQPAIDATYAGVVGLSIVQRPPQAGEISYLEPSRVGDFSFPAFAAIAINGWSGQVTADNHIDSGIHAEATQAFLYGLKMGGPGGTPYTGHTARSQFGTGISLQDFNFRALEIINPHPNYSEAGGGDGIYLGGCRISIDGAALTNRILAFRTANVARMSLVLDAGDNLVVHAFNNAGGFLSTPLAIRRTDNDVILRPPQSSAGLASGTLWNNAGTPAIVP